MCRWSRCTQLKRDGCTGCGEVEGPGETVHCTAVQATECGSGTGQPPPTHPPSCLHHGIRCCTHIPAASQPWLLSQPAAHAHAPTHPPAHLQLVVVLGTLIGSHAVRANAGLWHGGAWRGSRRHAEPGAALLCCCACKRRGIDLSVQVASISPSPVGCGPGPPQPPAGRRRCRARTVTASARRPARRSRLQHREGS